MRRLSMALVVLGVLASVLSGAGGVLSAEAERKDITINGNQQSRAVVCHGQRVLIDGNANQVQLRGHCSHVHVNGNANTVVLHAVAPVVSVNGNHNHVFFSVYHNPLVPRIDDNGNDNMITGIP